jgi:Mrp family chromosome partitioning ATPase
MLNTSEEIPPGNVEQDVAGTSSSEKTAKLVRLIKSIIVSPVRAKHVDTNYVKYKFYNSFNYSLLSREHQDINLSIGITSPKPGEGKTLIASNLAVSLAMGSQKNTVLIDLNVGRPALHKIFGVPLAPGLTEAFNSSEIHISQTAIENLYVLSAGKTIIPHENLFYQTQSPNSVPQANLAPSLGLDQLPAFRDILYSLEQKYELVIVDMPSVNSNTVPHLFANHMHGLIIVIRSGKTKREELDLMLQKVNEQQVLGFVLNHFNEK